MLEKNTGINYRRTKVPHNSLEKKFANRWNKINSKRKGAVLGCILSKDNYPVSPSDRNEEVAATVIQWLGTPVGREFLDGVFGGTNFTEKYK